MLNTVSLRLTLTIVPYFIMLLFAFSVNNVFRQTTTLGVVNSNAKDFSKKFSKCNM